MKKVFENVLIVMFENQYRSYVMQDAYMKKLAKAGCNMNNYFGAFHPSQTNYLASLAGEVCSVSNDTPPATPLMQTTLVDAMESAQNPVSWKAYMEAYPGEKWNKDWEDPSYPVTEQPINEFPNDGVNLARYYRKHNAFASFHSIQSSQEKWDKITDEYTFWNDVYNEKLPNYSWFTPDIWNDGHYLYNTHESTNPRTQLVSQLSSWLEYVFFAKVETTKVQGGKNFGQQYIGLDLDLDLVLKDPKKAYANSKIPEGTLVVVTWDEADYDAKGYDTNYDGQNQVYTVLLGDMITPGTSIDTPYNHYSLMRTIEQNFSFKGLEKNDKGANWFRFLWNEKFQWSTPENVSNIGNTTPLALSYCGESCYLLYEQPAKSFFMSKYDGKDWTAGEQVDLPIGDKVCLAGLGEELMCVFTDVNNSLCYSVYTTGKGWSEVQNLLVSNVGEIAITTYLDEADTIEKIMLAYQDSETQQLFSLIYVNGIWDTVPQDTGQLTDGSIAISSLGASVYLIYKERNTFNMRMTSFNTAPYNAFEAVNFQDAPDPDNDTSIHTWSPMDFLVGHFSKKMNQYENAYLANGQLALAAIDGELHMSYRARYEDTPQAYFTVFGLTGIMTAKSQNTNGFGTLNQAGWTVEKENENVVLDPDSYYQMASNGTEITAIYQTSGTKELRFFTGSYQKV